MGCVLDRASLPATGPPDSKAVLLLLRAAMRAAAGFGRPHVLLGFPCTLAELEMLEGRSAAAAATETELEAAAGRFGGRRGEGAAEAEAGRGAGRAASRAVDVDEEHASAAAAVLRCERRRVGRLRLDHETWPELGGCRVVRALHLLMPGDRPNTSAAIELSETGRLTVLLSSFVRGLSEASHIESWLQSARVPLIAAGLSFCAPSNAELDHHQQSMAQSPSPTAPSAKVEMAKARPVEAEGVEARPVAEAMRPLEVEAASAPLGHAAAASSERQAERLVESATWVAEVDAGEETVGGRGLATRHYESELERRQAVARVEHARQLRRWRGAPPSPARANARWARSPRLTVRGSGPLRSPHSAPAPRGSVDEAANQPGAYDPLRSARQRLYRQPPTHRPSPAFASPMTWRPPPPTHVQQSSPPPQQFERHRQSPCPSPATFHRHRGQRRATASAPSTPRAAPIHSVPPSSSSAATTFGVSPAALARASPWSASAAPPGVTASGVERVVGLAVAYSGPQAEVEAAFGLHHSVNDAWQSLKAQGLDIGFGAFPNSVPRSGAACASRARMPPRPAPQKPPWRAPPSFAAPPLFATSGAANVAEVDDGADDIYLGGHAAHGLANRDTGLDSRARARVQASTLDLEAEILRNTEVA